MIFNNLLFFLECWDGEPENRPPMCKVVERLKMIIAQSNINIDNYQNKSFDRINNQISDECIIFK